jgi:hypothetical protein
VEFSFRSLGQPYGRTFLGRVALRHPMRLVRAVWHYWIALGAPQPAERLLLLHREGKFVERAASAGERFLVATGFCQKPFSCPAGRFNHNCSHLSRLTSDSVAWFPPACAGCTIRVLGAAAFSVGASFAILTSASDIASDILLPALKEQLFTHALLAVCPYSLEPMSLALLSSGIEGYIVGYELGACANYEHWLRADRGDKPERTALSPWVSDRMLQSLSAVAALRREKGSNTAPRYAQIDNVYRPHPDCSDNRGKDQVPRSRG